MTGGGVVEVAACEATLLGDLDSVDLPRARLLARLARFWAQQAQCEHPLPLPLVCEACRQGPAPLATYSGLMRLVTEATCRRRCRACCRFLARNV